MSGLGEGSLDRVLFTVLSLIAFLLCYFDVLFFLGAKLLYCLLRYFAKAELSLIIICDSR